jgi:ribose-phosphate pyrophosphokinase
MKLFGLQQTRGFAGRLAAHLGVPLAAHEERDFEDGEFKVRPLTPVRGEHVIVCQSLAADARASVNDKLIRLLVFCGALVDAGARHVTALVPYLAYGRKDKRTQPQDPITTSYVARCFEAVGIGSVVTIEAHGVATFENAFRCRKLNIDATNAFGAHFAGRVAGTNTRVVVVAPDVGGVPRAKAFAAALSARAGRDVGLAFVEKHRSGGVVSGALFAGDVHDALAIIYDDLVSTGGTIARAAHVARARGAREIHAAAAHGLLVGDAARTIASAGLASLVLADTVDDVGARCASLPSPWAVVDAAALVAPVFTSDWTD